MRTLHIGGMEFETQDADQLDHALAVREVLLRSVLDARFVLYHHVVRRRVTVASGGEFESPFCAAIGKQWDARLAGRRLFVNEQFVTHRPPPGARQDGLAGASPAPVRPAGARTIPPRSAISKRPPRRCSPASSRTARGCCRATAPKRANSRSLLEFLSSIYNGEMRPVVLPSDGTDLGHHIPYKRVSFGLDAIETAGAGGRNFSAMLSIKEYPGGNASRPDRQHAAACRANWC